MSLFLNNQEICELTGRRRKDAQAKALRKMGIMFKEAADGQLKVLKSHITKEFGGVEDRGRDTRTEPNWGMVNA